MCGGASGIFSSPSPPEDFKWNSPQLHQRIIISNIWWSLPNIPIFRLPVCPSVPRCTSQATHCSRWSHLEKFRKYLSQFLLRVYYPNPCKIMTLFDDKFVYFQSQEEVCDLKHAAPFQNIIPKPFIPFKGTCLVHVVADA